MFDSQHYLDFLENVVKFQHSLAILIHCRKSSLDQVSLPQIASFIRKYSIEIDELQSNPQSLDLYCLISTHLFQFFLFSKHLENVDIRDFTSSFSFLQFIRVDESEPNPFGWREVRTLYRRFRKLKNNENGFISKSDLIGLALSLVFIDRFFESIGNLNGEIDFEGCLPLLIAIENLKRPQAVDFFFGLLDVDEDGKVGVEDMSYFYKGVVSELGGDAPKAEQYVVQIIDECQCPHDGFTAEMLKESGNQMEIIRMLIEPGSLM
jgi:Ca2+-binding EF-hand superfamily protein